ncbi:MAG TPA: sigma-70 family RNA polymerase sigma factor [Saprospiraceae bacterium]|nr:sigma-70 family RNA polymerase sigma factor [Saprospiraceae bacterium]
MEQVPNASHNPNISSHVPARVHDAVDIRAVRVLEIFEARYEFYFMAAKKYLRNSEQPDSVIADVILAAFNWTSERFDQIKNLEAYLRSCVVYRSINIAKKQRRQTRYSDLNDHLSNNALISNPMQKFDFDIADLSKFLPTKQRQAFLLFIKGYAHDEIAHMLRLNSEGASKSLIYYAKLKLRKVVNDWPDNDPDSSGSKNQKNAHSNNRILRSINNANRNNNKPGFRDLLNYMTGNNNNSSADHKVILKWMFIESYGIDVVSGLNYSLRFERIENLEKRIEKCKNELREKLLNLINQRKQQFTINNNPKWTDMHNQHLKNQYTPIVSTSCIQDRTIKTIESWKPASFHVYLTDGTIITIPLNLVTVSKRHHATPEGFASDDFTNPILDKLLFKYQLPTCSFCEVESQNPIKPSKHKKKTKVNKAI